MNLQNLIDYCQEMGETDILSGVILPSPLDANKCKNAIVMRCGLLTPVYGEPHVLREMISNWFSARQWNFEHLIKVIQAEYSPIENTDKYSEHTIERDGSNTIKTSGNDVTTLSGSDSVASSGSDTTSLSGTDAIASTGSDTTSLSGTDAIASTGTDTKTRTPNLTNTATSEISAENASTYQPDNRVTTSDTGTETDAMQHGKTDTTTYGKRETLQHGKTDTTTYGKRETLQHGKTDTTTYGKNETLNHERYETSKNDGSESYIEHTHGNIGITTNTTLIREELSLIKRFNAYDWIAERIEEAFFIMVY